MSLGALIKTNKKQKQKEVSQLKKAVQDLSRQLGRAKKFTFPTGLSNSQDVLYNIQQLQSHFQEYKEPVYGRLDFSFNSKESASIVGRFYFLQVNDNYILILDDMKGRRHKIRLNDLNSYYLRLYDNGDFVPLYTNGPYYHLLKPTPGVAKARPFNNIY